MTTHLDTLKATINDLKNEKKKSGKEYLKAVEVRHEMYKLNQQAAEDLNKAEALYVEFTEKLKEAEEDFARKIQVGNNK